MMVMLNFALSTGELVSVQALPGGIVMEAAIADEVPGIVAKCYGAGVCGTCHVLVPLQWRDAAGAVSEWETEMIDALPQKQPASRLSCQITVRAELDGALFQVPDHQDVLS